MRIRALINRKAGSAIGMGAEALASEVEAAFKAEGHTIEVSLAGPHGIEAGLDAAMSAHPDVILIGGGDGTVRCAAQRLAGTGIALGIIPLGTVNRVARDLKIPLDPSAAIRSLAHGAVRQIDAGDVNGRVFLCNSMMGLPPMIGAERQKLRGETFGVRAAGYFRILRSVLGARHRMSLSIGGGRPMRVMSVAVSRRSTSRCGIPSVLRR